MLDQKLIRENPTFVEESLSSRGKSFNISEINKLTVDKNKIDLLKMGYFYFKFYSNEIYKQAANNPSLYFIVDVLTTELKKISIFISEKNWDLELQEHLLKEILQLDNPPDYPKEDLDQSVNNGVRVLQIGLALHYIKIENFKKNPNKLNYAYVLTPKGITEKTKLTISFMKRKMKEYDELKKEMENQE